MMGQLKAAALNANTVPAVTANVNRSGTAIAQRMAEAFGPIGKGAQIAVTRLMKPFAQVGREMQAGSAARGVIPTRGAPGGVGLPGAGAAPFVDPFLRQLEDKLLRDGK
jgi:hypothetical protein